MQTNILSLIIKKNFFWIILLFIFLIINLISINSINKLVTFETLAPLMAQPNANLNLLGIYKIILITLLIYNFYTFEIQHTKANVLLRISLKKWIITKIFASTLIIVFLDIIFVAITNCIFFNKLVFSLEYYLLPILYDELIALFVVALVNLVKNKNITVLLVIIGSILIYKFLNTSIVLLSVIILLIFNYLYFVHSKTIHKLDF